MILLVVNIQRSSFYDGPGIRTTVFLKGCFLRCPWCCNPESISLNPQIYFNEEKCLRTKRVDCSEYIKNCSFNQIKNPKEVIKINTDSTGIRNCRSWIKNCPTEAIGIYGEKFEVNELVRQLKKDKHFYDMSGGGVTFSGGEPLLQAKELAECLKELKKVGIHTCIETSLFCPTNYLDLVREFVDLFIIDIKILDPKNCKKYLKGNLEIYLKNVEGALQSQKACVFRFPAIKPFTFNESNIKLLYGFIKKWKIGNLEIFSVHNLATKKYESLGMKLPYFKKIKKEELELLKEKLSLLKVRVKILTL